MISTDTLDRVIGADVYDADGDKIGTASEVFLDDESGTPEWVTVKTGMFGTKETFVPIRDAELTGDGVRVPVSKAAVKDAPKIDTNGHLSPQEEQELYRHYGMGTGTGMSGTDTTTTAGYSDTTAGVSGQGMTTGTDVTTGQGMTTGTDVTTGQGLTTGTGQGMTTEADMNRHGTVGRDVSGPTTDDAMTLSEERLNVGTERVEAGRARLRKYVVEENVSQTVPVSREEVRIEREPITDANIGNAMDGPAISEGEHEVTLHAERAVVEKEAVPVERVRLGTETVTEQQQVNETVRREEVDTDGIQGQGVTGQETGGRGLKDKARDMLDRDNDGRI